MSSIDERIVSMKFDNAQFERGIKSTLAQLQTLNKGLQLAGAAKGLQDVGNAASKVQVGHIATAVEGISGKFKAMSVVAVTALATVTHAAVSAAGRLVKSFTIKPILDGFKEYETNLNSIQTILANTGLKGQSGLNKVTAALDELNHYADQTIYNFSEMAKNIGTFTAAGVKLDVATSAIKGIANLAAVSGSNAEQASAAMYQLSQAISAGKVTLEDWNSVVNAGLGGKVFQDALIQTAKVHGVAVDDMIKKAGSFRLSLQEGWITGEILTETLSKFTGDLTASQLKTMGYNKQQIAGILEMAKVARDAATKVKTVTQLVSTLREGMSSGWAKTWQLIFGDFEEARTLFTSVGEVLGGFVNQSSDARNKILSDWKDLGGRTVLIEAVGNAFKALMAIVKPIKDAFRSIFPATAGKDLYEITVAIRDFTKGLTIGSKTAENLRRTFAGVFAVLGIGWDIAKEVVKTIFSLLGVATEGSGGFLEFTANIGDFLVGLRKVIKDGGVVTKIFSGIRTVLGKLISLLRDAASFIGSLFDGFDGDKAAKSVGKFAKNLSPLQNLGENLTKIWAYVTKIIDKLRAKLEPLTEFFGKLGKSISEGFSNFDFGALLALLTGGAILSFVTSLKGLIGNVSGIFDGLTGTMENMQNTLRAATLLQIAIAIAVLTASVAVLSKIDAAGLTRSLTAITVMFGQLFGMMLLFEKLAGFKGLAKMPLVAASLILLGVALRVLASSVKTLAELDWDELARGLTGVTALMAVMIATVKLMPNDKKMLSTGVALLVLSGAIKVLASAVTDLSGLSWEEMAKGLTGVAALLTALTLFTKFAEANKGGILSGTGLILLAAGVKILASALEDFSGLSWEEIGRGLVALAGSLTLVTAALLLIPPTAPLAAAGVLIVAIALADVADALEQMGQMSWDEIGRGLTAMLGALTIISAALFVIPPTAALGAAGILITAIALKAVADVLDQMGAMDWGSIGKAMTALGGSLAIITVAVAGMTGAISGAFAMLIVAAALKILAPVLEQFGEMSWEEMAKGLLMLAGTFTVIGVAGLLLAPVVPILIGLGVAIVLLGVGMLAAGVGLLAFSLGLTALSISGAAGAAAIVGIVKALSGVIPEVMKQIGLGVVAFAKVIATAGPAIYAAITAVLLAMIKAINTVAPKIITTLFNLLALMLYTIRARIPFLTDMGMKILIAFLTGIKNNIGRLVKVAADLIVAFINAVSKEQGRITNAGVKLIVSFVNGLASAIRNNSGAMRAAGRNLAFAIVDGMTGGLASGAARLANKAASVAKNALSAAKNALGINSPSKEFAKVGKWSIEGLEQGLVRSSHISDRAAANAGKSALSALKMSLSSVSDSVTGELDFTPQIRPVLDLSDIQDKAKMITGLLSNNTVSVKTTKMSASSASDSFDASRDIQTKSSADDKSEPNSVTFNQYNNSPKELSSADIYRQTKNQISAAKGALS